MEVSREEGTEALSHWLTALLDAPGGSPGHNLCHLAMFCIQTTSDTCRCPLDQKAELGWHPVSTSFPQNTDKDSFLRLFAVDEHWYTISLHLVGFL